MMLASRWGWDHQAATTTPWCMQILGDHGKAERYRAAGALRRQAMMHLMLDKCGWNDILLESEPGWWPPTGLLQPSQ